MNLVIRQMGLLADFQMQVKIISVSDVNLLN